jgi:hypothetical protein
MRTCAAACAGWRSWHGSSRSKERLFRDCDTRIDVQLHTMDRQSYRDALHDAILAMQRARAALVAVVQRA